MTNRQLKQRFVINQSHSRPSWLSVHVTLGPTLTAMRLRLWTSTSTWHLEPDTEISTSYLTFMNKGRWWSEVKWIFLSDLRAAHWDNGDNWIWCLFGFFSQMHLYQFYSLCCWWCEAWRFGRVDRNHIYRADGVDERGAQGESTQREEWVEVQEYIGLK